ncbi:hypothetical protein FQN54_004480 [Arachnomyces sp. PD_36]|nr:hypothetical protein FQN54_004480 [Arachnomyces sp. PD_36]
MSRSTTSLLLLGLSLASQGAALPKPPTQAENWSGWSGVRHFFTFGNSYTQTGFEVDGEQPSDANPMGNPPYPGWTSSNGPNWVGFLTTTFNHSTILNYNLAYGGATVDADLVAPYTPTVRSLKDQVTDEFLPAYGTGESDWTSKDSLFAFFIGINDVGGSYWDRNETLYDEIFSVYSGLVDDLYETGARNFLFLNVPPVDRAPLTTEQGEEAMALEDAAIKDWNKRVVQMAGNLRTNYTGTYVAEFDYHKLFGAVMDDPSAYPETAVYKNTTGYCPEYEDGTDDWYTLLPACDIAVNEYFWLNNLHPTFPVNNATAREIVEMLDSETEDKYYATA